MKRINESEYGDMHLDYDMRRFAGYDKWKKKQDEIEQLKQDAKVDKNAAWKVADGRLKHKQDNLNMAFDDRKKHQQDWIDNGKKGVKQGLKNGEFKYHGKKHKWPSNNPVPFQRSDDEKEVLAKFDKEPFFNNKTNESKNSMKKNIVKLNENTLKQIVAESVKNVLSEIDWKTYANAANKRRKQYRDEIKNGIDSDKWDRAQELDNAASRALSDKFGKNLKTWGDNWNGETGDRHVMDADAPWTTGTNAMGPEPTGYYYTSSKDRNWRNGSDEYQNGDYDLYGDIPLDFKNQSEEDKQNNNIGREIDNFTHDRYAYDNEKGWHLKESVEKAVKSVLKEYINKK